MWLPIARSKERAEDGRDFLDDDAQAQVASAQFGVQFVVRALWAFQDVAHVGRVLGKARSVRMARVAPMLEQALAEFGNAPEQSPVFKLGVLLQLDSMDEHGSSITRHFSQAIQCAWPTRHERGRAAHCVSAWAPANRRAQGPAKSVVRFVFALLAVSNRRATLATPIRASS